MVEELRGAAPAGEGEERSLLLLREGKLSRLLLVAARGGGKVAGASHGKERDGMCCLWEAQNVEI